MSVTVAYHWIRSILAVQLPAPFPFEFVDLFFAYFPMVWLDLTVVRYVKS